jgi:uncharacterized OB-fold protein
MVSEEGSAREFFAGAAQRRLMIRECGSCARVSWPLPKMGVALSRCPFCLSPELGWAAASGRGTIYSFALMHQLYDPALAAEIPYNLAVIELDEGIRTQHVRVVDCPNDDLRVGAPVQVTFRAERDGIQVPYFKPA